jgi:hypothetical protein
MVFCMLRRFVRKRARARSGHVVAECLHHRTNSRRLSKSTH